MEEHTVSYEGPIEKQVTRVQRVEPYRQESLTEQSFNQIYKTNWDMLRSQAFSPHPPNTYGSRNHSWRKINLKHNFVKQIINIRNL